VSNRIVTGRNLWYLVLGLLALWGAILAMGGRGHDLEIYLRAAERFFDGTPIYVPEDHLMPYKYTPATAWLFLPLCSLPFWLAMLIWNLGSAAALGFTAVWISKEWGTAPEPPKPGGRNLEEFWPRLLTTLALIQPIYFLLFYGQVNGLLLLLLMFSAYSAEQGRAVRSGSAFALAAMLKLPTLIFVIFFILRRRYRPLIYAMIGMAVAWLPVLVRYGPSGTVELIRAWLEVLTRTTAPWVLGYNNHGLPTLLLDIFTSARAGIPSGLAVAAAQLAGLVIFAAPLLWLRPPARLLAAFLCFGSALLSPHAWISNYVLAWPLLCLGLAAPRRKAGWVVFGIALLLVLMSLAIHPGFFEVHLLKKVLATRFYSITMLLLLFSMYYSVWDRKTQDT
jgi:alpha-1,2-mannosyltransferase